MKPKCLFPYCTDLRWTMGKALTFFVVFLVNKGQAFFVLEPLAFLMKASPEIRGHWNDGFSLELDGFLAVPGTVTFFGLASFRKTHVPAMVCKFCAQVYVILVALQKYVIRKVFG